MKNLNLIKRLWTDSHEKQSPQRFARYAAMLIMLLSLSVGQMWGIGFNKGNVIFRAQGWNNPAYVYLCIGKSDYTSTYLMSRIGDSDLYHVWVNVDNNDDNWWNGCTYFAVIGSSSAVSSGSWGSSSLSSKGNKGYTSAYTSSYDINNKDGCYFFNKNNSTLNNGSFTISYTSYSSIQKYNAIQNAKKRETGTSYSNVSGTFPAPIKLKGEHLTSNASSGRNTITRTSSSDGADKHTYSAVVTGTITHSIDEENLSSDYYLEGWGTSTTPSVTTSTYDYKITANTTVYAFFSRLYTLTFLPKGTYGTSTVTASVTGYTDVSSGDKIPTGHSITVTATPATGYEIVGWYSDADCTVSLSNGTKTTYAISSLNANSGVYVKFQKKTYSITLDDNGSYQGNGSATVQRGDGALTISSHASRTGWNLVGYWTASGDGGSQVTDAAGNLIANVSGFTDGSGNWIKDANVSLYAHWNQINSLSVVGGSNISSVTGSTSPVTLNTKYAISATPNTGYSFSGWTASPSDNGVFDDASAASTNVTVKNGSVTVTGAATENLTAVTVNVSPAGAGTLTKGGAAFTPGNSVSVGVTTGYSMVATPNSGYVFHDWTKTGNAAGTPSTNTFPLKGNGSAGTGTLTANFGVASGWYMEGEDFGGWSRPTTYQLSYPYRGMSGVYYYPTTLTKDRWWKVNNDSKPYNATNASTTIAKGTLYDLVEEYTNSSKVSTTMSNVWVVVNTNSTKKIWVQDPQTFHNVNVTNEGSGSKGTYKVTLKTTSAFTRGANVFETTQYANGETFTVTVTGKTGWIPTITIGGVSTTFWKEAATYSADGTMSSSDIDVSISYTATYAVTFAMTTGCGTLSAKGPGDVAISTGSKVKSGTSITFTQTSTHSGYDFQKWYSTSSGTSGTQWGTETSLTKSITAATSVYPIYTVHTYTGGTLDKKEGGEDGSYTVTYLATSITPSAPSRTGYNVAGYYKETGRTTLIADASGNLQKSTTYTDGSNRWTYTSSIPTLYTKWTAKQYNITLDDNGAYQGNGSATATYDGVLSGITHARRTGYHIDGYYKEAGLTNRITEADGTLRASTAYTNASSKWTNDGAVSLFAKWTANTYTIAFDPNDANYVGEATGTTASIAATYDVSYTLTTNGFSRAGYTFAGWARNADGTGEQYTDGQTGVSNLTSTNAGTVTLYAKWTGKTYTVTFNPRGGSGLSKTSQEVTMGSAYGALATVTPPAGYVFDGWYTSSAGGTKVTAETLVATPSDHTLYAHYVQKAQVYFKNTLGWSKVYVTYDAYWDSSNPSKGSGNSGKTTHLMTLVAGTTDVYYDDIPDAILSSWKGSIVFYNEQQDSYANFSKGQAVFRRDFDSDATMFVPVPNDPNKFTLNAGYGAAGTTYYSTDQVVDKSGDDVTNYRYKNGYWVRYNNVEAGYTVKGSWAWDDDHYVERHSLNDSTYVFTIRNLAANTDYYFNLYKHCTTSNSYSSVFKPAADMTSASSDVVFSAQYAGGSDKKMKTTVAGDYTFKFVFSRLGEIRLTIEYPLAVNDYRVVYSYTKGGAQTFASEYIKAKADAVDTISMFIHSADSATARSLYIQKCTGMTAGVPTWDDDYSAIALPTETASGKTSGVYNFKISQNGSKEATGEPIGKYNGNFYIRTDSAAGGWDFYKEYPSSQMTYSEYSLSQTLSAPYSHYYCQYVGNSSTDISYTIATDYSPMICPILVGDATIGGVGNKTLPAGNPASIRFTWNEETNATFRSYLKSAQGEGNKRFLVLHGSDNKVLDADGNTIAGEGAGAEQMHANELLFSDTENWVYELAFKAKPGAKVSIIARYNGSDRYLVGAADAWETIISGGSDAEYDIAAVYDFKTNRLITTWIPSGTISDQIKEVDVLIERHNQDGATTITFGKAAVDAEAGSISAKRVIGALRFDYSELVGRVASWTPDTRAKMMFFVSFPFDVNVSDIFGLNTTYGEAFIVQGYNGAKRAEKGFFKGDGTNTFWETLPVDTVMHAGVGYVVTLDNDYFNGDVGHIWDNKRAGDHVYMYFPSANDPSKPITINSDDKTIKVPAHLCTINRTFNSGKLNHKYTDSNWNVMGVPIFQNHTGDDGKEGTPGALFTADEIPSETTEYANPENPAFGYFYVWNTDKTYTIQSAVDFVFKPMHSYMVQYAGDVKFTCAEPVESSLAPRRKAMKENYNIELQVLNNSGDMLNHTYVELRENAVDSFALNEDIYMMSSNKAVSVYTFAGTYDVAANVLSIGSHVVPVGVIVNRAGTYTFTMPSNFSGTVTLVDTYAQTRTNLNIEDYEVSLPKGTDEERFYLEININKVPTAIDGAKAGEGTLKDGKVHKFIMNDQMYILKDGVLYDARGNRVK